MRNIYVRGISEDLLDALKHRASQEKRTVNQQVLYILRQHLLHPACDQATATRTFLKMAGSWRDDRSDKDVARDLCEARRTRRKTRKP